MKTLQTAADTIEAACGRAEIGVVLGSGLGDYVESLENAKSIAYKDIPGFRYPPRRGTRAAGTAARCTAKRSA
ncbi:MAG: hypothetical protein ACLUN6_03860 [Holdemanella sp.]|uniref:hypothetical protein n=1 Tax=Holdemanella sp. TaxID=1971762 RepID=UPI0039957446